MLLYLQLIILWMSFPLFTRKQSVLNQLTSLRKIRPKSNNKQNKQQFNQLSPQLSKIFKKRSINLRVLTALFIKQTTLNLLEKHFSKSFPYFFILCSKWIDCQWQNMRTNIQSRLTKMLYLELTLMLQTFSVIQKEIKVEWSKNPLLRGLQNLYNHMLKTGDFNSIKEINKFYECITLFISDLSYEIYFNSLQQLVEAGFDVEKRLRFQTSVSIIVDNKNWQNIYKDIVQPCLYQDCPSFSQNFNLESLNINPKILNLSSQSLLFPQTKQSLKKFTNCRTIPEFVVSLRQYRANLLREIQYNINTERKKDQNAKQVTAEKQDILGSIIYIIVKYKLDNIGLALRYLNFLLKDNLEQVLRWYQVDYYKTDIQVAYQFLIQPVLKISFDLEDTKNE